MLCITDPPQITAMVILCSVGMLTHYAACVYQAIGLQCSGASIAVAALGSLCSKSLFACGPSNALPHLGRESDTRLPLLATHHCRWQPFWRRIVQHTLGSWLAAGT